jgi:pyruvate formate-lyase/glycerol dehydratase family glycyl radical enzyme
MAKSYLERIKTELVTDPKLKQPITGRTRQLRDTMLAVTPKLCSERARLYTESWKETEGQPTVIRRAKALARILSGMSIFIRPGELIVGNQASDVRAAPVFPEFYMRFIREELDGKPCRFEERPGDPFRVSQEDEEILREVADWWEGKTMTDYKRQLLPEEAYKACYDVEAIEIYTWGEGGGSGHFIADYPKVLNKGMYGIIREAEERANDLKLWEPGALEQKEFLEAVSIALRAAINFAQRYAVLAREMAEKEADPKRQAELIKIAEHCEWVPGKPARTFWEAMQSLWFAHLIVQIESNGHSMGYGRFDQFMYPFYRKDIDQGTITPEEVVELLECLFIKTTEINKVRDWDATRVVMGYPMFQQLTVGGQTIDGKSAINDLSWLALEATANQKIIQPSLSVRWWNECPDDFLLKCCEVINIHRGGQPAMYSDEVIIPSQMGVGISLEDAYDYAIDGCVSITEPGKARREGPSAGYNMHKVLEVALFNGRDPRTGIQLCPNPGNKDLSTFESFDEVMAAVKHQLEYYDRQGAIALLCIERAYAELTPTPFASALMDDCIQRGRDIEWGGAHYNTLFLRGVGMSNVGNSLAAIKKLVFEDKRLTGAQIRHALETNFEDTSTSPTGPEIQQMLLATPKYGNDDDYVDLLVKEPTLHAMRDVRRYTSWTGGRGGFALLPVSQNVPFGEIIGATPDGRKAGVPTAEGCSPTRGTDVKGPTAAVKSVAKLDHVLADSGSLLNQKFNPAVLKDTSGLRKLAALIKTYFDLKGMHIQFNVVSAETLRDAQKHPEEYADLMVRVAGYSALFVSLDPAVQEDIIMRTEHSI